MRIVILILVLVGVLGGTGVWYRELVLIKAGKWLEIDNPLVVSDLVVALGGPSERQEKAFRLLKEGFARRILFTGPNVRLRDYQCFGITADEMIQPPMMAYRTYDEALVTKRVVERGAYRSAIVVTSPYHLRRVRMIFNRVFSDRGIRLTFYPSENKAFAFNNWWETRHGRKVVITEYLGLVYYGLVL